MFFDDHLYSIDYQLIPWGKSLEEVEALLGDRKWLPFHGGWPNLRSACRSVLGLEAVECNLRAPARHKPVMQVSYALAPPADHSGMGRVDPSYWVPTLTQRLGMPIMAEAYPEESRTGPSYVVYSAVWQRPTMRISLSVFGGIRQEESGPAAAGLYVDWLDEITAARPFYEAARVQEIILNAAAEQMTLPLLFETQDPHVAYYMYPMGFTAHAVPADTLLRQSKRALYREGLCETPARLQAQLHDRQVALWPVPSQTAWAVSTKFDTVLVTVPTAPPIELVTVRPAKGSGNMMLTVGDLTLYDAYNSATLEQLAQALEQHTGAPVSRTQGYDC